MIIKYQNVMAKLLVQVNKKKFIREERDEYGTIREAIAEFAEANSLKGANCVPVNAKNLATEGKQIILQIREVNSAKKPANLVKSDDIHVGREISDMLRNKEIAFSTLLDFPIIHHTNEGSDVEYLLVVRPSVEPEDADALLAKLAIDADTEVTLEYSREAVSVAEILSEMQV